MVRSSFLQKCTLGITGYLIVCLTIVATPYRSVEALSLPTGNASEATAQRIAKSAQISAVKESISSAANTATAGATASLFAKENVLDAIAWSIAKQMVSNVTRSLINWINSGFQGSPAFVTDLKQMLVDSLDQVAGEYIQSLGGIGEFICSPFKLDVQSALTSNYEKARSGVPSGPDQNQCTATGILSNVENFLQGTANSWEDWLQITSNPENTPYGSYLAAESALNIRLRNEAGAEIEVARFGDGFLSKKVCQAIEGTNRQDCKITTPGKVVSEALTFNLSIGQRTLIEADEVNELIGALMNQLILKAVEGLNGILGLSEDSGNGSYLDALVAEETNIDFTAYKREMDEALALELSFLEMITKTLTLTTNASTTIITTGSSTTSTTGTSTRSATTTVASQPEYVTLVADATRERSRVTTNIATLSILINRFENATATASTTNAVRTATSTTGTSTATTTKRTSPNKIRQQVVLDYIELKGTNALSTAAQKETKRVEWGTTISPYLGRNPLE